MANAGTSQEIDDFSTACLGSRGSQAGCALLEGPSCAQKLDFAWRREWAVCGAQCDCVHAADEGGCSAYASAECALDAGSFSVCAATEF